MFIYFIPDETSVCDLFELVWGNNSLLFIVVEALMSKNPRMNRQQSLSFYELTLLAIDS